MSTRRKLLETLNLVDLRTLWSGMKHVLALKRYAELEEEREADPHLKGGLYSRRLIHVPKQKTDPAEMEFMLGVKQIGTNPDGSAVWTTTEWAKSGNRAGAAAANRKDPLN